jgi:hypothetical protein
VIDVHEALFCGVLDASIVTFSLGGRVGLYLGLSAVSSLSWGGRGLLAGLTGWLFSVGVRDHALSVMWLGIAGVGVLAAGRLAARASLLYQRRFIQTNWCAAVIDPSRASVDDTTTKENYGIRTAGIIGA